MTPTQARNLSRAPAKPGLGRGRLFRQIRRCFMLGEVQSTSRVLDWCYVLNRKTPHRYSVWRVLITIAEPIGREENTRGRPFLWRIRPETA
jgi:hypothetical protein